MWGSATVLPSTEEINALLRFKPLPVKDHYVIYAKEVIHGQVVHVAKLLGEDPRHLPPCTPVPPERGHCHLPLRVFLKGARAPPQSPGFGDPLWAPAA